MQVVAKSVKKCQLVNELYNIHIQYTRHDEASWKNKWSRHLLRSRLIERAKNGWKRRTINSKQKRPVDRVVWKNGWRRKTTTQNKKPIDHVVWKQNRWKQRTATPEQKRPINHVVRKQCGWKQRTSTLQQKRHIYTCTRIYVSNLFWRVLLCKKVIENYFLLILKESHIAEERAEVALRSYQKELLHVSLVCWW